MTANNNNNVGSNSTITTEEKVCSSLFRTFLLSYTDTIRMID